MILEDTLVSVVIPVRNGERFLSRTLASALAQTYDPIEVVIVDDGSTDRTAALVEAAGARDSRIRFFRTKGFGVAAARNLGITQARGKLIAPLDADDLWHPEKIARQVGVMQASSRLVGLVYCWSIEIDENDFLIEAAATSGLCYSPHGRVTVELAKGNFLRNSSSPVIKRSCIDAVGGYDPCLLHGVEDWKLYLALSEICEFAVVREYLVGYRQWSASMSRDVAGMVHSIELVTRWLMEKWPNLPPEVGRERTYNMSIYLSKRALERNQFVTALRYSARASKARPAAFLERSSLYFGVRFLARMAGLRRTERKRTPVTFQEFQAAKRVQTNC